MTPIRHFSLVSLGCPKNRVDSEHILAVMSRAGFVFVEEPSRADVLIVNTCAFIESAVEESIDAILDYRDLNREAVLVVAGCLPLRYGDDLRASLREADIFLKPEEIPQIPQRLGSLAPLAQPTADEAFPCSYTAVPQRVLTTPGYAYLKIADGCSRKCAYCTIPSIRGPLRSRDLEAVDREARMLASQGVRELVLVAQDLTGYRTDAGEGRGLVRLLERLRVVQGIEWIRLMYLHPHGIPSDLAAVINESRTILPYLDIPFQHVSEKVLKAMGRPWKHDRTRRLVDGLRNDVPGLVLRTTLMVGFPGEGDKEFTELKDFVQSSSIEHVGVFTYSPEEGTPAMALGDPVPAETKAARADELRNLHLESEEKRNRGRVGSIERCIVEGVSEESDLLLQGRTWDQAPEVDGVLYITEGVASAGEIRDIELTDCNGPDLFGEIR
ncbi:MAG: 30S ribosomal protein S12 methylthiotransferase RimO [Desulfomonilaceae bacterium]|nr:30S ribosomal protein S12 methylthiotransferase RimO [Desulfomonilaceae bacterium]